LEPGFIDPLAGELNITVPVMVDVDQGDSAATDASSIEDGVPGLPAVRPGIQAVASWHLQRLE
jgi:hypothetical protein